MLLSFQLSRSFIDSSMAPFSLFFDGRTTYLVGKDNHHFYGNNSKISRCVCEHSEKHATSFCSTNADCRRRDRSYQHKTNQAVDDKRKSRRSLCSRAAAPAMISGSVNSRLLLWPTIILKLWSYFSRGCAPSYTKMGFTKRPRNLLHTRTQHQAQHHQHFWLASSLCLLVVMSDTNLMQITHKLLKIQQPQQLSDSMSSPPSLLLYARASSFAANSSSSQNESLSMSATAAHEVQREARMLEQTAAPICIQSRYDVAVPANTPPGTSILDVQALGAFGRPIRYSFIPQQNYQNVSNLFVVDPLSGDIRTGVAGLTKFAAPSAAVSLELRIRATITSMYGEQFCDMLVGVQIVPTLSERDAQQRNWPSSTNNNVRTVGQTEVFSPRANFNRQQQNPLQQRNRNFQLRRQANLRHLRTFKQQASPQLHTRSPRTPFTTLDATAYQRDQAAAAQLLQQLVRSGGNTQNHPPHFLMSQYTFSIGSCDPGLILGYTTANDPDLGDTVTYSIANDPPVADLINIDPITGLLRLGSGMESGEHKFAVQARDTSGNVAAVNVDVLTDCVQRLRFRTLQSAYTFENVDCGSGVLVGRVEATGGDPNLPLTYSLIGTSADGFVIEPHTGLIMTTPKVTAFNNGEHRTIRVRAVQQQATDNNKTLQASINVNVRFSGNQCAAAAFGTGLRSNGKSNANEQELLAAGSEIIEQQLHSKASTPAPVCSQEIYTGTVAENAERGSVVAQIQAADPNGSSLTYSIVGNTLGRFGIDALTGQIIVANDDPAAALPAREARSSTSAMEFTVRATNAHGLFCEALVRIAITGPPSPLKSSARAANVQTRQAMNVMFGQSTYQFVLQQCTAGSPVGTIAATTVGPGQVQYSLLGTSDFAVDAESGRIVVTNNALQTQSGSRSFTIQSVFGFLSALANVVVVLQCESGGLTVATSTTTAAPVSPITLSSAQSNNFPVNSRVQMQTRERIYGQLPHTAPFPIPNMVPSVMPTFAVDVQRQQQPAYGTYYGMPLQQQQQQQPNNYQPAPGYGGAPLRQPFVSPSSAPTVYASQQQQQQEQRPQPFNLPRPQYTPYDVVSSAFSVEPQQNDMGYGNRGAVSATGSYYGMQPQSSMAVKAPTFSSPIYRFTSRQCTSGTVVGTIMATDPNNGGRITYALLNSDMFDIDSATGVITLRSGTRIRGTETFVVHVQARNSQGAVSTASVEIMFTCSNNMLPPVMQAMYNFTTSSCAPNQMVGVITANDPNGDPLTYSTGNTDFRVDSNGIIYTNRQFTDRNAQKTFSVTATNPSGAQSTAQVNVQLFCGAPLAQGPSFLQNPYRFNISTCYAGTVVGNVTATSQNSGQISYVIQGTSPYYSIDSAGRIALVQQINGAGQSDVISVTAIDGSGQTATTQVYINSQCTPSARQNTAPVFNPRTYAFSATSCQPMSIVGRVTATDADGDPLTYSLDGPNQAVMVDPQTGDIRLTGQNISSSSQQQQQPVQMFNVYVRDGRGGQDVAAVIVLLPCASSSNRPPAPRQKHYTFGTTQCSAGTAVGQVQATDPDGDTVQYTIQGQRDFTVDPNGTITILHSLQGAMTRNFQVWVSDGRGGITDIDVSVNLNCIPPNSAPVFEDPSYMFRTTDCSPNAFVGFVWAEDPDSDKFSFSLSGTQDFVIDSNSGIVSLSEQPRLSGTGTQAFSIVAEDIKGARSMVPVMVKYRCPVSETKKHRYATAAATPASVQQYYPTAAAPPMNAKPEQAYSTATEEYTPVEEVFTRPASATYARPRPVYATATEVYTSAAEVFTRPAPAAAAMYNTRPANTPGYAQADQMYTQAEPSYAQSMPAPLQTPPTSSVYTIVYAPPTTAPQTPASYQVATISTTTSKPNRITTPPRFSQFAYTFIITNCGGNSDGGGGKSYHQQQPSVAELVGIVSASAADHYGQPVMYSLRGTNDFVITQSTGEIRTAKSFPAGTKTSEAFMVIATDANGLTSMATVTINIQCSIISSSYGGDTVTFSPNASGNGPPVFGMASFSLFASHCTPGTVLGTLAATNPDGNPLSYSISGASGYMVDSAGRVMLSTQKGGMLTETFTLTATDVSSQLSASTLVTVMLSCPSNTTSYAAQSAPAVLQPSVQQQYASAPAQQPAVGYGSAGSASLPTSPMALPFYTQSSPPSPNAPQQQQPSYGGSTNNFYSFSSSPLKFVAQFYTFGTGCNGNSVVGTVQATGGTAPVTYAIMGAYGFTINPTTGVIQANGQQSFNAGSQFTLNAIARDAAGHIATATVNVWIDPSCAAPPTTFLPSNPVMSTAPANCPSLSLAFSQPMYNFNFSCLAGYDNIVGTVQASQTVASAPVYNGRPQQPSNLYSGRSSSSVVSARSFDPFANAANFRPTPLRSANKIAQVQMRSGRKLALNETTVFASNVRNKTLTTLITATITTTTKAPSIISVKMPLKTIQTVSPLLRSKRSTAHSLNETETAAANTTTNHSILSVSAADIGQAHNSSVMVPTGREARQLFNNHFLQQQLRQLQTTSYNNNPTSSATSQPVVYTLSGTDLFSINSNTGAITATDLFFKAKTVLFTVTATTSQAQATTSCPQQQISPATAQVIVTVGSYQCVTSATAPSAGSPPVFSVPMYAFSVPCNALTNSVVGSVLATDNDYDMLQYSITGPAAGYFNIDPVSGQIRTTTKLSASTTFMLTATASDGGSNYQTASATAMVLITVTPCTSTLNTNTYGGGNNNVGYGNVQPPPPPPSNTYDSSPVAAGPYGNNNNNNYNVPTAISSGYGGGGGNIVPPPTNSYGNGNNNNYNAPAAISSSYGGGVPTNSYGSNNNNNYGSTAGTSGGYGNNNNNAAYGIPLSTGYNNPPPPVAGGYPPNTNTGGYGVPPTVSAGGNVNDNNYGGGGGAGYVSNSNTNTGGYGVPPPSVSSSYGNVNNNGGGGGSYASNTNSGGYGVTPSSVSSSYGNVNNNNYGAGGSGPVITTKKCRNHRRECDPMLGAVLPHHPICRIQAQRGGHNSNNNNNRNTNSNYNQNSNPYNANNNNNNNYQKQANFRSSNRNNIYSMDNNNYSPPSTDGYDSNNNNNDNKNGYQNNQNGYSSNNNNNYGPAPTDSGGYGSNNNDNYDQQSSGDSSSSYGSNGNNNRNQGSNGYVDDTQNNNNNNYGNSQNNYGNNDNNGNNNQPYGGGGGGNSFKWSSVKDSRFKIDPNTGLLQSDLILGVGHYKTQIEVTDSYGNVGHAEITVVIDCGGIVDRSIYSGKSGSSVVTRTRAGSDSSLATALQQDAIEDRKFQVQQEEPVVTQRQSKALSTTRATDVPPFLSSAFDTAVADNAPAENNSIAINEMSEFARQLIPRLVEASVPAKDDRSDNSTRPLPTFRRGTFEENFAHTNTSAAEENQRASENMLNNNRSTEKMPNSSGTNPNVVSVPSPVNVVSARSSADKLFSADPLSLSVGSFALSLKQLRSQIAGRSTSNVDRKRRRRRRRFVEVEV